MINYNVDLGKAFDKLKAGLAESEAVLKDEEKYPDFVDRFAKSHGWLLAHVSNFIKTVEVADPLAEDKAYDRMQEVHELNNPSV